MIGREGTAYASSVKHRTFSPSYLFDVLSGLPRARAYWIALSGGADSVALLRSLAEIRSQLPAPLKAIHINHGLQPQAPEWVRFCQDLCLELRVPCTVVNVNIERNTGGSLEARARQARYEAIKNHLGSGEAVVTAHHQDDQVETVLLHLVKGAGTNGLAAMPVWRSFADGFLFRPLLGIRRAQLMDWLTKREFSWVEDESNQNLDYDRNYLRHEILPKLEARWSGTVACLARSARLQAAQSEINAVLAKLDLATVEEFPRGTLAIDKVLTLTPARRDNLLYWWLCNKGPKVIPSQRQLEVLHHDLLLAGRCAHPGMKIGNVMLRRYQNSLYKIAWRDDPPIGAFEWRLNRPLELPQMGLYLEPQILLRLFHEFNENTLLTLCFRQGGERFKPRGSAHSRRLKQLFQVWRVPVWKRERVGLIYYQGKLVMIWGYAQAAK